MLSKMRHFITGAYDKIHAALPAESNTTPWRVLLCYNAKSQFVFLLSATLLSFRSFHFVEGLVLPTFQSLPLSALVIYCNLHRKLLSVALRLTYICGSPGQKSNIIPLRIANAFLRSKRCNTVFPLRAGLIRAV